MANNGIDKLNKGLNDSIRTIEKFAEAFSGARGKLAGDISDIVDKVNNLKKEASNIKIGIETSKIDGTLDKKIADFKSMYKSLSSELNAVMPKFESTLGVIDHKSNVKADLQQQREKLEEMRKAEINLRAEADKRGLSYDNVSKKINLLNSGLVRSVANNNQAKSASMFTEYQNQLDKIQGKITAYDTSVKTSADNEKRAYSEKLNAVKNYVSNYETLNNTKMSYKDQMSYYDSQLSYFRQNTNDYIAILKLRNQAEANYKQQSEQQMTNVFNTISKVSKAINNAMNKVVSVIRSAINIINKVMGSIVSTFQKVGTTIQGLISLFGNLGNRVRTTFGGMSKDSKSTSGNFNILTKSATELRSKILLLTGAFNKLFNNSMLKQATTLYASVYSLKNIVGAELTTDTIKWAESMERAFGISAKGLLSDLNELTGVLYGLGMKQEDVVVGSENILMIARYLSFMGAAGGDTAQVVTKLVSGMKGMTQAIDDLGLSVREAQMDSYLKDLKKQGGEFSNIATSFASLNEEARVYVRYSSLISQFASKYDMTTFANAMDTTTGRITLLKQSVQSLGTTIGQVFAKVFGTVSKYLIVIVNAVEMTIRKLAAFVGLDLSVKHDMNENGESVDSLNGSLDDTSNKLDKVEEKAKKASNALGGFDRIESLNSSKDKDSEVEFDYSSLMNSTLAELNKLAGEINISFMDKAREDFKATLNKMMQDFDNFAKDITGRSNFDLGFNLKSVNESLNGILSNVGRIIKEAGTFVIEIGLKIADDMNIGLIFTKITELTDSFTNLLATMIEVLTPAFSQFYDIALAPMVVWFGEKLVQAIDLAILGMDNLVIWFETNSDVIEQFFVNLGTIINGFWEQREVYMDGALTILTGIATNMIGICTQIFDAMTGKYAGDGSGGLWDAILYTIATVTENMKTFYNDCIVPLAGDLFRYLVDIILPDLLEMLRKLSDWLAQNSDQIREFISYLVGLTWNTFKVFVDLVGKLIDFVVKNPEAVTTFFVTLIGLKVASWFGDVAAKIGLTVMGLKELAKFVGIGSLTGVATGGGAAAGAGAATGGAVAGGATAGGAAAGAGAAVGGITLGPILLIIAAIVALTAAITDLWDTSERFRENMGEFWQNIKDGWNEMIEEIKIALSGLWEQIKEFGGALYDFYESSGLKLLVEALVTGFVAICSWILDTLLKLIGTIIGGIVDLCTGIVQIIQGAIDVITGIIDIFVGFFVGLFTGDWSKLFDGFRRLWGGLKDILEGAVKSLWAIVSTFFETLWDIFGDMIKPMVDWGAKLVCGLWDGMKSMWSKLTSWVSDSVKKIGQSISDGLSSVKNFFTGGASKTSISVQNGLSRSASRTSITSVPAFATGGTPRNGQLFLANEAGPELVGSFGNGGTSVANNSMIIEAMKKAVYESTYNALAEIMNQSKGLGGKVENHYHMGENGVNLYDDSTIAKFARYITEMQGRSTIEVADQSFTI